MTRRLGLPVTDASPLITLAAAEKERNVQAQRERQGDVEAHARLRGHLAASGSDTQRG